MSLMSSEKPVPPHASARIQRWNLTMSMYQYTLYFKTSMSNANADAFSRLPLHTSEICTPEPQETVLLFETLSAPLSSENIAEWTTKDPILSKVLFFTQSGWPGSVNDDLQPYFRRKLELSSYLGCLLWNNRVIVPAIGQACVE